MPRVSTGSSDSSETLILRIPQSARSAANYESSVPLLTAFGSQAAIAIENARLFKQVKADLDEAQHEVKRLRLQIEIDHKRVKEEVGEITESKYFQELSSMANDMRRRHHKADG
jgi:transposase-like protein